MRREDRAALPWSGRGMNFTRLTSILQSDLPCAQRMILAVLLNHAGDGTTAYPSHASIAKQAGLAERSVWGHLKELETSGWISKAGNVGRVTVWEVINPANSATHPAAVAGSIPQILPDEQQPIPQILRDNPANIAGYPANIAGYPANIAGYPANIAGYPANIAGYPANSATLSRKICELTTQEPHKNHSLTTQPEGASKSPPVVELKVKSQKPDWREWNRANAEKANAVQPPLLVSEAFRVQWQRWREYRTALAVDARIASEATAWTVQAAESGLRDCERAAEIHGWPAVIARMDQAMQGWRGFNFDRMTPPRAAGFNGQPKPKHAAYDAATATLGLTAKQIGEF